MSRVHYFKTTGGKVFFLEDKTFFLPILRFLQNQYKADMKRHLALMDKASKTQSEQDIDMALKHTKYMSEKYREISRYICHPADLVY